jgi:hypothetical protein
MATKNRGGVGVNRLLVCSFIFVVCCVSCCHSPAMLAPMIGTLYGPFPATASCDATCIRTWWIFDRKIGRKKIDINYVIYPAGPEGEPTGRAIAEMINLHTRIKNAARENYKQEKCDQLKIICITIGGEIELVISPKPTLTEDNRIVIPKEEI